MGKIYRVGYNPEICCDECNNVIHNHFDCPICNKENAGTSIYWDIAEHIGDDMQCENCNSLFKIISEQYKNNVGFVLELELVKEAKHNHKGI